MLLDEYIRKKKRSITPVFRVPYDITQKAIRTEPVWPLIRRKQENGKPVNKGKGSVIYRFMVNHERVGHLKGYDQWQQDLYPDPPADEGTERVDPITKVSVPYMTLQAACGNEEFSGKNLWNDAREAYEQVKNKRADDNVLEERWRRLTATRVGNDIAEDENDDMEF